MTDYEKLKGIIDEIDKLIEKNIDSWDIEFQAWETKAERFLINKFNKDSYEHQIFSKTHFSPFSFGRDVSQSERIETCKKGLEKTKAIFLTYLEDLSDDNNNVSALEADKNFDKVFIVHGHDGEMKHAVARLVEKQGLTAVILSEQANPGDTIIEKFEKHSDVGGAICLFTADDLGHAKTEPDEHPRARQNVVFEAGYFMGKLGRDKVVIIAENGVELPSDMQGIVYFDKNGWQFEVLKELKMMGYSIDLNKLF